MGTKNQPGAFDCYANALPDEEMFVLLSRDPMAPVLVRAWAFMRAARGEGAQKVQEALACSLKMENQLRAQGKEPVTLSELLDVLHTS